MMMMNDDNMNSTLWEIYTLRDDQNQQSHPTNTNEIGEKNKHKSNQQKREERLFSVFDDKKYTIETMRNF